MRHTRIRRTITRVLAGTTAVALNLAVGVTGALAKTATTATTPTTGSGQDLMSLANGAGSDVHTIALIAIAAGMAVTAVVCVWKHKWTVLLVGMGIAIGAFLFVNGGASNLASNTANNLSGAQASGTAGAASGIPGVNAP